MTSQDRDPQGESGRQPIFLIPGVILALVGLASAVQIASTVVLNEPARIVFMTWFGFVPYRLVVPDAFPGGLWPLIWTPITYAFLHGGWEHLLGNMAWLVIFGTPVARRYGTGPTLAIFFLSSIAGALAFAVTAFGGPAFLIGASGAIAGFTGAAIRFMFEPVIVAKDPATGQIVPLGRRLASVHGVWHNPTARNLALLWIGLNCVVPLLPMLIGEQVAIAWQAHLGGFFAGFFLVQAFDRPGPEPAAPPPEPEGGREASAEAGPWGPREE